LSAHSLSGERRARATLAQAGEQRREGVIEREQLDAAREIGERN